LLDGRGVEIGKTPRPINKRAVQFFQAVSAAGPRGRDRREAARRCWRTDQADWADRLKEADRP
jgi:hypothetical protein